jgi:ribosomal protein L11 methyltransferase
MKAHAALRFDISGESRESLEGFFLTHTSFAGSQENDDGSITFFVPSEEWNADLHSLIQTFCGAEPELEFIGAEIIEDRDWNAEWEATIDPMQATPELVITPSWKMEDAKALEPKYIITIDPKMSFGTGHHETTRLCLAASETLDITNRSALDIGTGSGVLAIYALQRGANHAVGIDTDTWAVANTIENRELNALSDQQFEVRQGTLDVVPEGEVFDVIFANIHRNVLLEIAKQIRSHVAAGAYVILSGILVYDAAEVRAAYEKANFTLVRELQENEWTCLIFQSCE